MCFRVCLDASDVLDHASAGSLHVACKADMRSCSTHHIRYGSTCHVRDALYVCMSCPSTQVTMFGWACTRISNLPAPVLHTLLPRSCMHGFPHYSLDESRPAWLQTCAAWASRPPQPTPGSRHSTKSGQLLNYGCNAGEHLAVLTYLVGGCNTS